MSKPDFKIKDIEDICKKYKIVELSVFGSILRDDFHAKSDVDVILSFDPKVHVSLFDLGAIKIALEGVFGRSVDIVTRRSIEMSGNKLRQEEILGKAKVLYAKAS